MREERRKTMSSKAIVNAERCKECRLCTVNCPKNAIEMTDEINSRGYKHVRVDEEKCVGCGTCYLVCPDGVFEIVEEV